jgi:hypothetical protein
MRGLFIVPGALRWFARSEVEAVTVYYTKTDNPLKYGGMRERLDSFG